MFPTMTTPAMTAASIRRARRRYLTGSAGDLFYRAALFLIAASRSPKHELDLAESLAVLLQTWNLQFYRFRGGFKEADFQAIRALLKNHGDELERLKARKLDSLRENEKVGLGNLFHDFEMVLWPVGAAKALHLLAPNLFPLWDQTIANKAYGIRLKRIGLNADNYLQLMTMTAGQVRALGGWDAIGGNPLKAIDEFNYAVHTRGWII